VIRTIKCEQLFKKRERFLESAFGTPAPDRMVFLEVGDSSNYDVIHIQGAIYLSLEQIIHSVQVWLPNPATEIVLISNNIDKDKALRAARLLSHLGYGNIYLYLNGKEDWISQGLWTNSTLVPADGFSAPSWRFIPEYPPLIEENPWKKRG